jgi:predicted ester cyclase
MNNEEIKQWISTYINEIWNNGDFSNIDSYWSPQVRNAFATKSTPGHVAMKSQIEGFRGAFSSFRFEIEDMIVEGEKIVIWGVLSGKHTGNLLNIEPTGKNVRFQETVWFKLKNGKIDEICPFVDWNSLLQQLSEKV